LRVGYRSTILLTLFAALLPAAAQQTPPPETPKPPQLKLEVIPLKKTYAVGETVVVKYLLTSLVDGTLCFPQPAVEVSGSFQGYLTLETRPRNGGEDLGFFIDDVWPRHPTDGELRSAIAHRWIKLGMSEPYQLRRSSRAVALTSPGEWEVQATYHPPDLTAPDKEIVKSMGCSPPDTQVRSDPFTITVESSPN